MCGAAARVPPDLQLPICPPCVSSSHSDHPRPVPSLTPPPPSLPPPLSGKDATEDFDEIGHSNAAKEQLAQYYIGEFEGGDVSAPARARANGAVKAGAPVGASPAVRALQFLLPLLAVLAAVLLPKVLSS